MKEVLLFFLSGALLLSLIVAVSLGEHIRPILLLAIIVLAASLSIFAFARTEETESTFTFTSSAITVLFLVTVSLGTVGGWMLGKRGIPLVPQAYLQSPPVFDICGFPSKTACQNAAGCVSDGFPNSCYYHAYSAEWCCPMGCTLEQICGDLQVVGTEQCDHGGGACAGPGGTCDTVENFKRCIAKGGTCAHVDDIFCGVVNAIPCQNKPPCGNGICAGGENCNTCATDCACAASQTCTAAGTCTGSGPPAGPSCGNGTVNPGEQCDDGNTAPGDGCSATCVCEACGDGYKCATEQCDDGCIGGVPGNPPGCDAPPPTDTDACSNSCIIQATCTDVIKNQGEKQVDCGGPCPACPCSASNPCNDGEYCTVDTCVAGSCQYTLFNGAGNNAPCNTDYKKICVTIGNCFCNELTDRCELCSSANEAACKTTSNALCQDHGNPTGCYEKAANQWCCPGRE